MKLCEETVTVLHATARDQTTAFVPTVVAGVSWHGVRAESADRRGGLAPDALVAVRIPAEAMPDGLAIAAGDLVARGETGANSLAALRQAGVEFMTVLSVTDNRRAPNGAHVKVIGA